VIQSKFRSLLTPIRLQAIQTDGRWFIAKVLMAAEFNQVLLRAKTVFDRARQSGKDLQVVAHQQQ